MLSVGGIIYRSSLKREQFNSLAIKARRSHPFPYRTRKLSFSAPMVVGTRVPVRVGRCQAKDRNLCFCLFISSFKQLEKTFYCRLTPTVLKYKSRSKKSEQVNYNW